MKYIINQLKTFGYAIEEKDNYHVATRDLGATIIITINSHITFSSSYSTNSNAFTNHNGVLRYISDLNNSSYITTFLCEEQGSIECYAKYLGLYDLSAFAEFIRAWEFDTCHLMNMNKDTDIYLMPEKELEKAMESYCHTEGERVEA